MDETTPQQSLLTFLSGERSTPTQAERAPSAVDCLSADNVRDFCRGVLASREYRQSVLDRVVLGTLAPAIETRFYDYAYGKPVERVEFKDTSDPLDDVTAEQLEERAARLYEAAQQLRRESSEREESVH
jgi:hypothetical protein